MFKFKENNNTSNNLNSTIKHADVIYKIDIENIYELKIFYFAGSTYEGPIIAKDLSQSWDMLEIYEKKHNLFPCNGHMMLINVKINPKVVNINGDEKTILEHGVGVVDMFEIKKGRSVIND